MMKTLPTLLIGLLAGSALTHQWSENTFLQPALAGSDPEAECRHPAYLLVWIDNLDTSRTGAYGKALRETQIVARHGGEYLTFGAPARLLEGEWPEDRSIVIERYPCLEEIERLWYSDQYQNEIMPLRANSGDYTVAAFEAYLPAGESP